MEPDDNTRVDISLLDEPITAKPSMARKRAEDWYSQHIRLIVESAQDIHWVEPDDPST